MKWVIMCIVAAICSSIGHTIGDPAAIFSAGVLAGSINTAIVVRY